MDDWKSKRILQDDKPIVNSLYNAILYIENLYAGIFGYDRDDDRVYVLRMPPWLNNQSFKPRICEDVDIINMSAELELYGLRIDFNRTQQAIKSVASKNLFKPEISQNKLNYADKYPAPESWTDFIKNEVGTQQYANIRAICSKLFFTMPGRNSPDHRRVTRILRQLGYQGMSERIDGKCRRVWKRVNADSNLLS